MSSTPTWALIVNAISTSLTTLAVLLGGIVGYNRYLRRREARARCELELGSTMVSVNGGPALKVDATVKNGGSCRLIFMDDLVQDVRVAAAFPSTWLEACTKQCPPSWAEATIYREDLLRGDDDELHILVLEPGQRLIRSLLVPVPNRNPAPVAYRVTLSVNAHPRMVFRTKPAQPWSTESVTTKDGVTHG
jgi:hypothetical protein